MPRILLFAATTGYQTRSFTDAAERLGIEVILATDRCHIMEDPWGDRAIAVKFDEPEASALRVAEALGDRAANGVIAVADGPTLAAAHTAARLGLAWHSPAAAAVTRDKYGMRTLFENAGLPVPRYERISAPHTGIGFPCVLKPLHLSGSRGVIRANNPAEFAEAYRRIRRILHNETPVIQVEQYIAGREFALEGLMSHGVLQTLAIFDKPDPLEGPFFEETIYVTPSRETEAIQHAIIETTARAARVLGLTHGPIHAEMRVNEQGVYMLEIAARPIGGLCSRVLRFRTPEGPIALEELLILHAAGALPAHIAPADPASGVMMIPVPRAGILQGVHGLEAALATPGIEDAVITAKPGERLIPLPEGSSYTGFLFARGASGSAVEESLRRAHGELRFDILSALDVLNQ
jgi:formate-dependent phosphoribosylglycinamide formyltransferase (GAR transformylase)